MSQNDTEHARDSCQERLWVFRTSGASATWSFLAWLSRYEEVLEERWAPSGLRPKDTAVTAIGTTVLLRWTLVSRGNPWPCWAAGTERERMETVEEQLIAWVEEQASVACIRPGRLHSRERSRGSDASPRARPRRRCRRLRDVDSGADEEPWLSAPPIPSRHRRCRIRFRPFAKRFAGGWACLGVCPRRSRRGRRRSLRQDSECR